MALDPKSFLQTLTHRPGVYRMIDIQGQVLYVGKAKDLKQRVGTYFRSGLSPRIQRMIAQITAIEITVTNTETEALLLENNLIKTLQPRYNVLLRDDKSYPYIYLSSHQQFPRLSIHRGNKNKDGRYFGPYSSAGVARESLKLLQRLFPVRQCKDIGFRHRTRPCLQYQLKRCSGPCVGLVTSENYAQEVENSILFLEGKTNQVTDALLVRMDAAAQRLEFEEAARLRNQVALLRRVQEFQHVSGESGDIDAVAIAIQNSVACVQIFFVREGRVLGNQVFFLRLLGEETAENVTSAFLSQYYLGRVLPIEILTNHKPLDIDILEVAFNSLAGRKVAISTRPRGERAQWLKLAASNAKLALDAHLASHSSYLERLKDLSNALGCNTVLQRLECFDVSHTSGERPVAACVVFDATGPRASDYRRFNIENINSGDDYAAMSQALTRRYRRTVNNESLLPDLLCLDGGRGQLAQAEAVLGELGITGIKMLGIAKGPERKPGLEQLWISGRKQPLILPSHSPALHLLQQLRDEAHRFAITGHKHRRRQARNTSVLEEIPGIGPKRRQLLLKQFGGLQGLTRAGVEDIGQVAGIGKNLAQQIYGALHLASN